MATNTSGLLARPPNALATRLPSDRSSEVVAKTSTALASVPNRSA
jgi:hypothetical protein